jgi:polysaccharide export outer membrane protein
MTFQLSLACRRRLMSIAAAALTLFTARVHGQQRNSPPASEANLARASNTISTASTATDRAKTDSAYIIGPGDLLAINVWNEPEVTGKVPVRMDGKISVPLVGEIQASGLTPDSLQASISKKLNEFVKQAAVTVVVEEMNSRQFNVLGEVQRPGSFPLIRPTHVLDALAQAGGFRDFAKVKKIYVLRRTPAGGTVKLPFNYRRVAQGDVQDDLELQAGDTVIVP